MVWPKSTLPRSTRESNRQGRTCTSSCKNYGLHAAGMLVQLPCTTSRSRNPGNHARQQLKRDHERSLNGTTARYKVISDTERSLIGGWRKIARRSLTVNQKPDAGTVSDWNTANW